MHGYKIGGLDCVSCQILDSVLAFYLYLLCIQVTSQPVVSADEERFLYGQIL